MSQHNMVLSFSRVFGSNTASNWLAQAAYSLDQGTDLRVDVASWWTTRVACEVGRYLRPTPELRPGQRDGGPQLPLAATATVLFPHGVIAAGVQLVAGRHHRPWAPARA